MNGKRSKEVKYFKHFKSQICLGKKKQKQIYSKKKRKRKKKSKTELFRETNPENNIDRVKTELLKLLLLDTSLQCECRLNVDWLWIRS